LRDQRKWLGVILSSIGDAVITTDTKGCVTCLDPVAQSLTGWTQEGAVGVPLESVFKIVNEETRRTVENRATRALREGVVVGLANHTLLIATDGTERSIDNSAAPIRHANGEVAGVVLVSAMPQRTGDFDRQIDRATYVEAGKTNLSLRHLRR
jgi:PAS domain S-box-containing protein